jgi:NADPH2:quinone reductase
MQRIRLVARQLQSNIQSNRYQIARMSSIPQTMKALQIHSQGGLDVLAIHDIPVPKPKEDEVLVKVEHSGVNYIDTYLRGGLYPRDMPFILGNEPSGTVVEVGANQKSKGINVGDRITSYIGGGGFAEYVSVPRSKAFKLPDAVDTKLGAAATLQGLTGEFQ